MKRTRRLATLLIILACAPPAIAQSSDETAKRFHVFPQLADGGGWQSVLLVTNASQSTNLCMLELHGDLAVDRFQDAEGVTLAGSTATFELSGSGGYRVWRTKNESALASGYATLGCTDPVVAQVLYGSRDGSGTTTGMATVFSSQAGGVFQFPVLPESRLGIAIANDTDMESSCRVILDSRAQQRLGEAPLPVASKTNVARFLDEVIPIPDGFNEGSATVSCDHGVSVIGLQFEGAIFTTLPPALLDLPPQPSDETAKRSHAFPQLADGGGWQSVLLVTNAAQSTNLCMLELHGDLAVDRFQDAEGVTATGSTATFSLIAPAGYFGWRTKNESALASGYATLDCTDPVVAQVLYASRDGSGTTTGMATVFSSQAGGVFQFPVLTPDASLGIAIANDTDMEASCHFVLDSPELQNLGQATLPVPSKSNVAQFLSEVIPVPDGFTEGSATVSCDQGVSVIGLQFEGAIFTTLPAAVLSTTPVSFTTSATSIVTAIGNIDPFLDQCPENDPAYTQIRRDFEMRLDGEVITDPVICSEPATVMSIQETTYVLQGFQALRLAYHMNEGTEGRLPWTNKGIYEWMASNIYGFNHKTDTGSGYCCDRIDGKLYISRGVTPDGNYDLIWPVDWSGISRTLAFFAHETRHADVDDPGHATGCEAPGCDATYDLSNLGGYGVQYWLHANWASGHLNVGIGCSLRGERHVNASVNAANQYLSPSRFVTNPPPLVTAELPYGGPCIPRNSRWK